MPLPVSTNRLHRRGLPIPGLDRLAAAFHGLRRGPDPIRDLLDAGVYSPSDVRGVLAAEVERARRYGRPFSVVLLQVATVRLEPRGPRRVPASASDLVDLGRLLLRQVRTSDGVAIDPGCAQFMLILLETDLAAACAVVRRLETTIARSLALTARWGLAHFPSCGHTAEELVRYALAGLDAEEIAALEVGAGRGDRVKATVA